MWVIADKNAPGRRHAAQVTRILNGHVPELCVFEAAPGCHDLSDHIAAGLGLDDLVAVELAPSPPEPGTVASNGNGSDEDEPTPWEPLELGSWLDGTAQQPQPSLGLKRS